MTLAELKKLTRTELMTDYGYDMDDADALIEKSVTEDPEFWNENAIPASLAEYLASDEED